MPHRILTMSRAASVCVVLLAASGARADCKKVSGRIEFQTFAGPSCTSPVGLCATGVVQRGLKGDWIFTGTSLTQTVDTPTTAVVFVTADETFSTADGNILVKSAMAFHTTGGEFASVDVIIGGTGAWAGVTGTLTTTGVFTSGAGSATFKGDICMP